MSSSKKKKENNKKQKRKNEKEGNFVKVYCFTSYQSYTKTLLFLLSTQYYNVCQNLSITIYINGQNHQQNQTITQQFIMSNLKKLKNPSYIANWWVFYLLREKNFSFV